MAGWRPAPGVEKVVPPLAPAPIYCGHRRMDKVPHVEWVDVVDEQDRVIGVAERTRVRQENLRHRASYILVLDEAGRVLVQRRTLSKDFCPGMLDACAGGVVTTGEAMEPSARRELAEELGIRDVLLQDFGTFYAEGEASGGGYRVWGGLFSCHYQGPLQLQAEEVSDVHWMSLAEIAERADEFTPDSLLAIATWQARRPA